MRLSGRSNVDSDPHFTLPQDRFCNQTNHLEGSLQILSFSSTIFWRFPSYLAWSKSVKTPQKTGYNTACRPIPLGARNKYIKSTDWAVQNACNAPPPALRLVAMIREISLSLFCLLFVGTSCANAGVMLGSPESQFGSDIESSSNSMSVSLASLLDQESTNRHMSQRPTSSSDYAGSVSSSSSIVNGSAFASIADDYVAVPKVECKLLMQDSAHPPSPDLDGLIKPPQASC